MFGFFKLAPGSESAKGKRRGAEWAAAALLLQNRREFSEYMAAASGAYQAEIFSAI